MLNDSGGCIPGLYAAGNTSAAVMGDTYPGAGATIGSAMTFAYIAAQHAFAAQGSREDNQAAALIRTVLSATGVVAGWRGLWINT